MPRFWIIAVIVTARMLAPALEVDPVELGED
jgi:hypothetical protein